MEITIWHVWYISIVFHLHLFEVSVSVIVLSVLVL